MPCSRIERIIRPAARTNSALTAALAVGALTLGVSAQTAKVEPMPASTAARVGAQPVGKGQPVRRGRTQKQPLVNLEQQAQSRRSGQVMPGDPPPERYAPPMQEPASTGTAAESLAVPTPAKPAGDTKSEPGRDPASGRPVKPAPAPVDADSGPRPLPRSAATPKPAPRQTAAESLESGVTPVPGSATASASEVGAAPAAPRAASSNDDPAAPASAPAEQLTVRVLSASGTDVQWRPVGGAWGPLTAGITSSDRFEIRTGLDGEAVLDMGGRIGIRVGYVSRAALEMRSGPRGAVPTVVLERGSIELRAESSDPTECWVKTPDRSAGFAVLAGARVAYSAFSGTSVSITDSPKRSD